MHLYDIFISHASEDKDDFVRPLVERLAEEHIEVWYDEFTMRLGDSLRASIDRGLAQSRFGLVVLSPSFLRKNWTERELNGLVAREMIKGEKVILPIWHGVSKEAIYEYSPPLADLVAVSTERGLDEVVRKIVEVVRPQGSPLVIARNLLFDYGVSAPVVTDEWWLNVVEASNREYPWGFMAHQQHWGRWTFPLPHANNSKEKGNRLAWTAMQMRWESEADAQKITQITEPSKVLDFINSQNGLLDTCHAFPNFLATYAPQLTIKGFGGEFEEGFEEAAKDARNECFMLRQPLPEASEAASLTCQFVQGELHGPPCRYYLHTEYLVWLLSDKSDWLPYAIKDTLINGFRTWVTWVWYEFASGAEEEFGIDMYPEKGVLLNQMEEAENTDRFTLSDSGRTDILRRFEFACSILGLDDLPSDLVQRFLDCGLVSGYFEQRFNRKQRRSPKPS